MPRSTPEIPNASMADIAFLLLTFFLVTTTISNDRGLSIQLPPPPEKQQDDVKIKEHNMFKIQVNSSDALLVEGNPMPDASGLRDEIKKFILNGTAQGAHDPLSSDSPEKQLLPIKQTVVQVTSDLWKYWILFRVLTTMCMQSRLG